MKNIKKFISNNPTNILLGIISIVALIIGSFAIGFWTSLLIVAIIDFLLFGLPYMKNIKNFKLPKRKSKKTNNKNKATRNESQKTRTKTIKKSETSKKKKWKKIFKIFLTGCFILGIILLILVCFFFFFISKNAPEFNPNNLYTKESSNFYDIDGKIFAKIGLEKREKITYNELPEVLINAIIATEDSRYFQHNGFDLPRFVKASFGQLLGNSYAGGASTITMQLVKNSHTGTEDKGIEGIIRKFTDIYMSMFKLEKKYSKEEILEFYVNSYYMGGGSYGVEQACLTYFGKSAKDINLSEAAIIAGLFQSPNTYNPLNYPEKTEARRNTVLSLMVRHGYISEEERKIASTIPVESLLTTVRANENEYQAFIDTVVAEIEKKTKQNPYIVPMEIYTTMDRKKQEMVNNIMNGKTYQWENDKVDAGISVLDTKTGAIVAIGTGRNKDNTKLGFNNATQNKRQIGSSAKPLYDYGPGIEYNNWSTYTPWIDETYTYSNGKKIENWDGTYQGFVTSRNALAGSRNIPALKAFQSINNRDIKTFVTSLGLSPEVEGNSIHEAHSIGGYTGETPLSMSAAYASFANKGNYIAPYSYTKIVYRETGETINNVSNKVKAMSEETAYMVTDMLVTTSTQALYAYPSVNGYKYAAKTGTTNFSDDDKKKYGMPTDAINDLWAVGMTDEYSIAVWYGYTKIDTETKKFSRFGNTNHMKLFNTIAKSVFTRGLNITKPTGVVEVTLENLCVPACLPSKYTPADSKITELFKKGTEPTEVSNRFDQLKNPTNLNASYSGGMLTLTWDAIATPNTLDKTKMTTIFKSFFKKDSSVNVALNTLTTSNSNRLGTIVYDIYIKNGDALEKVDTTSENTYTYNAYSNGQPITYVVKAAYSKFKDNASTGTETTITFTGGSITNNVTSQLIGDAIVNLNKNNIYTDQGKGILVYDNMIDVTNQAKVTLSIRNSSNSLIGTSLSAINFSQAGEYTITYNVTYNSYSKNHTRKIIIN